MGEWIRFGFAAFFLLCGMLVITGSLLGVFRFKFVLNRMHFASIIDTLGLLLILVSLMIAGGGAYIGKLLLILMVLWIGSPISAHLVSRLEITTDETAPAHMKIVQEEKDGRI